MKNVIIVIILSCSLICANSKYLIKERIVKLSAKIQIKVISTVDIDKNKRILICDESSKAVYLFSPNGNIVKEIKPSINKYVIGWQPVNALFHEDNKITIITLSGDGYLFDDQGIYIKHISSKFVDKNVIPYNRDAYISISKNDKTHFIQQIDKNGLQRELFRIYPMRPMLLFVCGYGGIASDLNGDIYCVEKFHPKIYKYSKTGKYRTSFFKTIPNYNAVDSDIPRQINPETMKKVINITNKATMVINLDYMTNEKLFYQVLSGGKVYFQIIDLNGTSLLPEYQQVEHAFIKAKDDYLISIVKPGSYRNDKIENPTLVLYTINYMGN